jgi:hypothetical protein
MSVHQGGAEVARRPVTPTIVTQLRHLLRFGDVWTMPVMRGNLDPRRQDDLPPGRSTMSVSRVSRVGLDLAASILKCTGQLCWPRRPQPTLGHSQLP